MKPSKTVKLELLFMQYTESIESCFIQLSLSTKKEEGQNDIESQHRLAELFHSP